MRILFPILAYLLMGVFEVVSDILSKKWALGEGSSYLIIAMGLYTVSALLFAVSLKFQELSSAILIFAAVNTVVTVIAGHFLFNERMDMVKIIILALVLIAVALEVWQSFTQG